MAEKDTIVVLNIGVRTFHTSKGPLNPNETHELPKKEALSLMDYPEIKDMGNFTPKSKVKDVDVKELERLRAQNEKQAEKIKLLQEENDDLKEQLAKKKQSGPEPE